MRSTLPKPDFRFKKNSPISNDLSNSHGYRANDANFGFDEISIHDNSHIGTKFQVGLRGDAFEKEVDRLADGVTIEPKQLKPRLKRAKGQKSLQLKNGESQDLGTTTSSAVAEVLQSPGKPLDKKVQSFMEPRYGYDFSRVKIHTDSKAAQSAREINATAYTTGRHIVFQEGRYTPETDVGQRLIAHELAHVVQQGDTEGTVTGPATLQRQATEDGTDKEEKKEKDAGEVMVEGLKTVAEQAKDNNPKVKKEIIEPLEKWGKGKWKGLSTGEKAVGISFGVATIGLTAGSLLSDPKGRKLLEGMNLGAPLKLVPYMPLTGFKYTLPSSETGEKSQFQFETTFSGDDYLKLLKRKGVPDMSLSVKMQWAYDPDGGQLRVRGAQAKLGLMPGVKISAGTYSSMLQLPETFVTPEGGIVKSMKRIPDIKGSESIPDVRVMLNIDLLKLDKRIIGKRLHNFLRLF